MDISNLADDIGRMMDFDLFIDPLLVYTYSEPEMDPAVRAARELANAVYQRYVHLDAFVGLGEVPYSDTLMRWGLVETILATAMWISQQERAVTLPDEAEIMKAYARLSAYIAQVGIVRMYWVYYCIIGHDMMQPLWFAKEILEADFLSARRHHPYPRSHVELCFLVCLGRRIMKFRRSDGERTVTLTRHGTNLYEWIHDSLRTCGYLDRRISMSYLYQFDRVEDWDDMCQVVWPEITENRRKFIHWVGVRTDDHVLEIACGTGALTFDAGLYEAVGPRGMLTATDSSTGMLDQARKKWHTFGAPPQVILKHASVTNLPFAGDIFDVVCGSFFLHFVDPMRALQEMVRVARPGGTVAVYQPLETNLDKPFFRDWFKPVYALARRRNAERPQTYLPTSEQVATWFAQCRLDEIELRPMPSPWIFDDPEVVVQHIVRGISFFEQELAELPWDDRKTVIAELIDRGRDVRRKYPLSERVIQVPGIMVKGVKRRH